VKRPSDGELAELCAQLIDLLDRGSIQHSFAGHAAAFARKPDGVWRICYDRGLNAITCPAVEPLPHIDALFDVCFMICACSAWRRGASAGRLLVGFRPADCQPGGHVAEDEEASIRDASSLSRRDQKLPPRRDAPAVLAELDGPVVA
jgi:hypothetical protein